MCFHVTISLVSSLPDTEHCDLRYTSEIGTYASIRVGKRNSDRWEQALFPYLSDRNISQPDN